MDNIELEREAIKSAYPYSEKWAERVDKMSSAQVSAVYIRMRSEGKLGK